MLIIPKNTSVKSRKKMKSGELEYYQSLETEFKARENQFGSAREIREIQSKVDASLRRKSYNGTAFPHSRLYQRRRIWWAKELMAEKNQIDKENNELCKKIESGELNYPSVRLKR